MFVESIKSEKIATQLHLCYGDRFSLSETSGGMDNAVFTCISEQDEQKYIAKVYRTKSATMVKTQLWAADRLGLEIENGLDGCRVQSVGNHAIILYKFIPGIVKSNLEDGDINFLAYDIASFHGSVLNYSTIRKIILEQKKIIRGYAVKEMFNGVARIAPDRAKFYREYLPAAMHQAIPGSLPTPIGMTHGDLSLKNIVFTPQGNRFIDHDNLNRTGHQILDLVDLFMKSNLIHQPDLMLQFLSNYGELRKQEPMSPEAIKAIMQVCAITGLKYMMSTDYYTYVIKKHNPGWEISSQSSYFSSLMLATKSAIKLQSATLGYPAPIANKRQVNLRQFSFD